MTNVPTTARPALRHTAKALRSLALDAARAAGMVEIGEFAFQTPDSRRCQVVTAKGTIDGQPARVQCGSKGGEFWRVEVKSGPYAWVSILEPIRVAKKCQLCGKSGGSLVMEAGFGRELVPVHDACVRAFLTTNPFEDMN
jgi:hypothetical protein